MGGEWLMDKKKLDDITHFVYNKERKAIIGFFKVDNVMEFGYEPESRIEYQTSNAGRVDKLTKLSNEDLKAIIKYGDGYLIKPKSAFVYGYPINIRSFEKISRPMASYGMFCQYPTNHCMNISDVRDKPRYAYAGRNKVIIVPMTQKQCDVFVKDVNRHRLPHYIAVKSILKCHKEVLQ